MAYNTKELKKEAIAAIKKHKLIFIEDIVHYLCIDKTTFYRHFPVPREDNESNKSNDYKELQRLLFKNRLDMKTNMRKKWYEGDNASLQMGLMKLLGTEEERKKLSQQFIDIKSGDEKITGINVAIVPPKEN